MTIATLIDRLCGANPGLSQAGARDMLGQVEAAIADELVACREVGLVGFGRFSLSLRAAGKGRNPRTGEEIDIAAKRVVRFHAGKALSERLNPGHSPVDVK